MQINASRSGATRLWQTVPAAIALTQLDVAEIAETLVRKRKRTTVPRRGLALLLSARLYPWYDERVAVQGAGGDARQPQLMPQA